MSDTLITIDTTALERLQALLPAQGEVIFRFAEQAMHASVHYLRAIAQRLTREKDLIGATGHYAQGWQTTVTGHALQELTGKVTNACGYAVYVEYGRGPGKPPPLEPIMLWAKRKGLAAEERELRSVAFLIARAIGRRGTIARFMQGGVGPAGARVVAETAAEGRTKVIEFFAEATRRAAELMARRIEQAGGAIGRLAE